MKSALAGLHVLVLAVVAHPAAAQDDPWDFWTLEFYTDASADFESRQRSVDARYGVYVNRVTENWKIQLRRRLLETDYEAGFSVGFRYRLGSIFNNVVNPRLNGLGSQDRF